LKIPVLVLQDYIRNNEEKFIIYFLT